MKRSFALIIALFLICLLSVGVLANTYDYNSESGGYESEDAEAIDNARENLLIAGLLSPAFYLLPAVIIRAVKGPKKRKSVLLFVIPYGIFVHLLFAAFSFWAIGDANYSFSPCIIWSTVNYFIMHKGYKEDPNGADYTQYRTAIEQAMQEAITQAYNTLLPSLAFIKTKRATAIELFPFLLTLGSSKFTNESSPGGTSPKVKFNSVFKDFGDVRAPIDTDEELSEIDYPPRGAIYRNILSGGKAHAAWLSNEIERTENDTVLECTYAFIDIIVTPKYLNGYDTALPPQLDEVELKELNRALTDLILPAVREYASSLDNISC